MKRAAGQDESEMEAEARRLIDELKSNWCEATLARVEEFESRSPRHERCLEEQILRRHALPANWLDRSVVTAQRPVPAPEQRHRMRTAAWRWGGITATLLLVTVAMVVAWKLASRHSSLALERTATAQASPVALTDGSDLLLYAGSRAIERTERNRREIALVEGGLSVRVEKDPERSFLVITPNTEVVAEGTQFSVIRRSGGTDVCVREGVVRVSSRAGSMRLRSGDSISVADSGEFTLPEIAIGSSASRLTHFNNTTLAQIAAAFNKVNCSVQFEVAPDVAGQRVNASLDLSRPEIWTVILERDPTLRLETGMGLVRVIGR